MPKYDITKTNSCELAELKKQYLQQLTAPIDGMWECFIAMADHFSIAREEQIIGFCAINADQKLLQFYLSEADDPCQIFRQIITERNVSGAILATCESQFLSLCLDLQESIEVKAFMYHVEKEGNIEKAIFPAQSQFRSTEAKELETAVEFGVRTLDADSDWLKGYFTERIEREELFGLWLDRSLIATGECRISKSQKPHADLGIIVAEEQRGEGIATNVLRQLLQFCREIGLAAICSTEGENIAAQKAITKAGFISHHRIIEITF